MFKKKQADEHARLAEALAIELDRTAFIPDVSDNAPVQIAEYYAAKLDDLLKAERESERALTIYIDDATEKRRQTRLVIANVEAAQAAIAADVKQ